MEKTDNTTADVVVLCGGRLKMTCKKGRYYIACENRQKGITIKERQGYIIDDKFGFTKNEQGFYIPTDLESGFMIYPQGGLKYSLVQSYQATKKCYKDNPEALENYKKRKDIQKATQIIKELHAKSEERNNERMD